MKTVTLGRSIPLLLLALTGCGSAGANDHVTASGPPDRAAAESMAMTCGEGLQVEGFRDYPADARGAASPAAAARSLAGGDEFVLKDAAHDTWKAYVQRNDGSVHSVLLLEELNGTWIVGMTESCPDGIAANDG